MVEESSDDHNSTTNKGVNVHSDSLPARVHRYSDSEPSSSLSNRSITDVKNEIQNVLDLMGPSTPHLTTQNTSSEADNEDSVVSGPMTSQTTASSSKREKKSTRTKIVSSEEITKYSTSSYEINKDSVMADAGTFSTANNFLTDEFEHSCCGHAHNCHVNPPECMCMYMNPSNFPVTPSRSGEAVNQLTNKSTKTATSPEYSRSRGLLDWLRERSSELILKKSHRNPYELYKINISGQDDDGGPPKKVVFDLVEGIPKPSSCTVATNTIRSPVEKIKTTPSTIKNQVFGTVCTCKDWKNITNETITQEAPDNKTQKIYFDSDGNTRVDYYYFDHGNASFFHTTDTPPVMKVEIIAEKTERYTTKFWAEFFASIHIAVSFCVSFLLQLFKFLLYSILRPLTVGLMQMGSDYWFKPCLTTCFNGVIQPFLIFLYNIATSVRDLCDPIAEAIGYFWKELAVLFRAIRLCTYRKNTNDDCDCNKKHNYESPRKRKCEC